MAAVVETGDNTCKVPSFVVFQSLSHVRLFATPWTAVMYWNSTKSAGHGEAFAVSISVLMIRGMWPSALVPFQAAPPGSICMAAPWHQHLFPGVLQQEKILAFGAEGR